MKKFYFLALAGCLTFSSTVFAEEIVEPVQSGFRQRIDTIMQESKLYIFSDAYRQRMLAKRLKEAFKAYRLRKEQESKETRIALRDSEREEQAGQRLDEKDLSTAIAFTENVDKDVALSLIEQDFQDENNDAVYLYYDNSSTYTIRCRPGFITDITLQPGERLLRIDVGSSTDLEYRAIDENGSCHIYLQPLQKKVETNMIITTDRRSYQLDIDAGDDYWPIVAWRYSDNAVPVQKPRHLKSGKITSFEQMDFGYTVASDKIYSWQPEFVFTDGKNTYIKMPEQAIEKYQPQLLIDIGGSWQICPYEVIRKNDLIVVDGVLGDAQMIVGSSKRVVLSRLAD